MQKARRKTGTGQPDELQLKELLKLFVRHKFLFLSAITIVAAVALGDHFLFPTFKARSSISVQNASNDPMQAMSAKLGGLGMQGMSGGASDDQVDHYLMYLNSYEFLVTAASTIRESKDFETLDRELFRPENRYFRSIKKLVFGKKADGEAAALTDERIANMLSKFVTFARNQSESINIFVSVPDRNAAGLLANFIAETAVKVLIKIEERELEEAEGYIRVQIAESEKAIKRLDSAIADFKRNNQVFSMSSGKEDSARKALELRQEISEITVELEQNNKKIESLRARSTDQQTEVTAGRVTSYKFGLPQRIAELERHNESLQRRQDAAKKVLDDMFKGYDQHYEQRVIDLRRKMELEYALFESLKRELFQTEVRKISVKNKVRRFESARPADVTRNRSLASKLLFSVLITLLLATPITYGWELSVPKVKDRSDLEDFGMIFLGNVPELPRQRRRTDGRAPSGTTQLRFDVETPVSMAFVRARTRLLSLAEEFGDKPQVISILSPEFSDGKSFVARNLAACFAQMKKRTLIIDCDLRKGATSEFFQTDHMGGLGEVLSDAMKFGQVVNRKVLPFVDLLSAGAYRQDVTELFAMDGFAQMIEDLRSLYDYIILDTPSAIAVPDAALIAKHSDVMIMVAANGKTTYTALNEAMDSLLGKDQKRLYSMLNRTVLPGENTYVFDLGGDRRAPVERRKVVS